MRESREQKPEFSFERNFAEEECPTCGNPKSLKLCRVCKNEVERAEYKAKSSANKLSEPETIKETSEKPEIPIGSDGKPKWGPGSDSWEESKRKILSGK